jgi:hypothetical protein
MASSGDERDDGRHRVAWASERVYRALIRAYPQEVRRRYAEEMVLYFGDLCREEWHSGGPMAMALLWARTLPDLILSALKERGAVLPMNAYMPVAPAIVTRWGAKCALVGGSLGVSYFFLYPLLLGALMSILTEAFPYGSDPFTMFFMPSLLFGALSLSSLGLLGLYGAVVARSGRPGLLAGTGALFSAGSAVLWLATSVYFPIYMLASSGSALFAPFEWVWNTGTFVIPVAMLLWFLGFLLLGIAAFRQPLPARLHLLPLALFALIVSSYLLGGYYWVPFGKTKAILLWFVGFLLLGITTVREPLPVRLRVLPLALFAFIVPSYSLGHYFTFAAAGPSGTETIVMGLAQSLPFVGIVLLGWVLLKAYDDVDEPLAVSGASAESVGAPRVRARSVGRTTSGAWGAARSATTSGAKVATQEKELLEAIRRLGEITVAQAALETSLSVEEADRMLSALAARGHLHVHVDGARMIYSLWESDG